MKISIALTLLTAKSAVASIKIAKFGGCHNQTAVEDNLKFHCQYDSTSCNDGEVWLNSFEAEDQGFGTCTCDDDYNNNVFGYACYDMKNTHAVECAANGDQCPEGWYHIGERFNSAHNVDDMCGHGDAAFGDDTSSCGKRCTCNFQYQSRDTALTIGSTTYGMCHDEAADTNYCAVHKDTCHGSETFYNPHSAGVSGFDCTCENVHVGGCMDGSSFSHCGVAQDSCKQGQMFLAPRALREANGDVDCRLCHDSWSEGSAPLSSSGDTVEEETSSGDTVEEEAKSSDDNPPAAKSDDDKSSDDKSSDDKSSDDKSSDDTEVMSNATDDDDSSSVMNSCVMQASFVLLAALFLYC